MLELVHRRRQHEHEPGVLAPGAQLFGALHLDFDQEVASGLSPTARRWKTNSCRSELPGVGGVLDEAVRFDQLGEPDLI